MRWTKRYNKIVIFPFGVGVYEQTQILSILVCFVIQAKHEKNMDDGYLDLGEIWSFCMLVVGLVGRGGGDPVPNLFAFSFRFREPILVEDIFHHQILDFGGGREGGRGGGSLSRK